MAGDRLVCEPARLDWSQPSGPRAGDYGDIYFSVEDGLEETRSVFLKGCDLPAAWSGRGRYVVGELGFGTGLNALALWQMWTTHRPSGGWLHFLSVEKHPLTHSEAARALAAWPELEPFSRRLLIQWPPVLKGAHRLVFPEDGFTITLFHDDVERALGRWDISVDAWFLDGFAPAKNEAMWSQPVLNRIGELSAPGARIGTFTVAGAVRRGLVEAGFEVEKRQGFGKKRERLEACYSGPARIAPVNPYSRPEPVAGRVAVLGAGIAGASAARALAARGRDVVLIDPLGTAGGASGVPSALLTPRLERADRPHVRATMSAFHFARNLYAKLDGFHDQSVMRLPKDGKEATRLAAMPDMLGPDYIWSGEALELGGSGWLEAARIVRQLIGDMPVLNRNCSGITEAGDGVALISESGQLITEAAAVIDARGHAVADYEWISPSAGQLAVLDGPELDRPVSWGHFLLPHAGGGVVLGANHLAGTDAGPQDEALAGFRASVEQYQPDLFARLGSKVVQSWSGVRASTPDRLPVAGSLPPRKAPPDWACWARREAESTALLPISRRYILSGLGSRGFAHAPLLGEMMAGLLCGEPLPLEADAVESLHPVRFLMRALKRS